MARSSIIVYWISKWHHCSVLLLSLLHVLFLVTRYQVGPRSPCLGNLPGVAITCPLGLVFSSSCQFRQGWSYAHGQQGLQALPILWRDGLLSYLLLLSPFWRGTMCYSLLNFPAIDHLPRLPNVAFCLFFVYSHISWDCISHACLEHCLPPTTTISRILSILQVPAAPKKCDVFPSLRYPLVWLALFYHSLPEPWRKPYTPSGIIRSHFCHHLTAFGQMLMSNDSNCFFCRLGIFTHDCEMPSREAELKEEQENFPLLVVHF